MIAMKQLYKVESRAEAAHYFLYENDGKNPYRFSIYKSSFGVGEDPADQKLICFGHDRNALVNLVLSLGKLVG